MNISTPSGIFEGNESHGAWTRALLKAIDMIGVENSQSELIDLFSAVDRLDKINKNFLPLVVNEDCPELAERKWERNLSAIAYAINRVEGEGSPLLNQILVLARNFSLLEVEKVILEIKGA